MGQFFVSGTNASGAKQSVLIEAATAKDALAEAQDQGLNDPVLETDEISALHQIEPSEVLSEQDLLQIRRSGRWGTKLLVMKKIMLGNSIFWGPALILFSVNRFRGAEWGTIDLCCLGILIAVTLLALILPFWPTRHSKTSNSYEDLLENFVQADWPRVIELAEKLDGSEIPQSDLAFRKASALAAMGNLEEALNLVAPWVDGAIEDPVCPEWVAKGRLADVYDYGGMPQQAYETAEEAATLAPESAVTLLDLAISRLTHGNVAGAQQAIDDLQHHPVSAELIPVRDIVIGCITNERGEAIKALDLLLPARERIVDLVRASPIWKLLLATIDYEIAISYSISGDADNAAAYYRKCGPLLHAHKSTTKLSRGERLTRHTDFPLDAQSVV